MGGLNTVVLLYGKVVLQKFFLHLPCIRRYFYSMFMLVRGVLVLNPVPIFMIAKNDYLAFGYVWSYVKVTFYCEAAH